MVTGVTALAPAASRRAGQRFALLSGAVLLFVGLASCAGRSTREEGERGGDGGSGASSGDAGTSSGAVGGSSAGGVSAGGTSSGSSGDGPSTGATSGTGPITTTVCGAPVAPGPCRGYQPSYWFDASTGVCMPFVYGGCEGNANRFATMEDCYATCGGRGVRDDAACTVPHECKPVRLAEPCCTTDIRQFVAVRYDVTFTCSDPLLGCTLCAADCATTPEDGYIGATCTDGHCVPFDARELEFDLCTYDADCVLRYGSECCEDCAPDQYPSKLVAMNASADLTPACGPRDRCDTDCVPPPEASARCMIGRCRVVFSTLEP